MTAQTTRFKKKLVVRALMLAFSAAAITAGLPTDAFAQSNATGNIYGQVSVPAGTSIVIENKGTGAKRTITPDATGRFQATSLPIGEYRVQLVRDGKVAETNEVEVLIGQGAEVRFAGGQTLQTVQVVSRRASIDVSSTNNGATFTSKELDQLPIARTVDAIIQLAPNTTRADPRYANNAASMGGGAPSENSAYINGFPVTNPLNQLGSSQLPFGAIEQAQVLTGGFGAEFGRSMGGVLNITTKSGTNEWHGGVQYSIEPSSLRSKYKDILYPNTGDPTNTATDGTLYRRRSVNKLTDQSYGFYVGGPIIKDKLFMFVAAEETKDKFSGVNPAQSVVNIRTGDVGKWGWSERRDTTTRYLGKFDWNVTDNHHLELTMIGDESKRREALSGYDYTTGARDGITRFTANYKNAPDVTPVGMNDTILKYTGYLTDDLTVTALYGEGKSPHSNGFTTAAGGFPEGVVLSTSSAAAPGVTYTNPNPLADQNLNAPSSQDKVKAGRFDLEYKLGQHTIRGGLDEVRLISNNAGDARAGGGTISYRFTTRASGIVCPSCTTIRVPGTLGANGYYGRERIFTDITDAYSDQSAQYIEDRYQVNKNLLLTFGLRNESFTNKNNVKETFLEQKNVLSPRFSAAWDVLGDASFKVFGSAGRYSVQIPTHIAVRGAGPSLLTDQYFTYTGVDPVTGQPTGRVNVSPAFSIDNELNQPKDAKTLAATNLKPNQQDEITLGFEKALNPDVNYGARVTYRKLVNTIDDFCDETPFDNYATAHGIDTTNWGGFNCASINPGRTNTFLVDYSGTGKNYTTVALSAQDMGFQEKAKRTYTAIDLFLEHPFRNGWYGRVNYTWSRSTGNTEGQTLSDIGQTDVAATQTWDNQYVMQYANGVLPNDRTHQIKAFGYYALTPEWMLGANALIASGRPRSCLGFIPDPGAAASGISSGYWGHYCFGNPSPRGTFGHLPWDQRLDLNVTYRPERVKGLSLRMDLFNAFNKQHVEAVNEQSVVTLAANQPINPTFGRVIAYSSPRSVKFTARYDF